MKDEILTCIQCERTFVFSASQKGRFLAYGFDEPKRCPNCRKKRINMTESHVKGDPYKHKKKSHSRKNRFNDYEEQ